MNEYKNFTSPCDTPEEIKKENKYMSTVFFTFAIAYVVSLVFLLTFDAYLHAFSLSKDTEYIIRSIISASHTPLIFAIMLAVFKRIPSAPHPVTDKMSAGKFLNIFCVCIFLMVIGSLVGNGVTKFISSLTGKSYSGIVADIVKSMKPAEIFILAVILGPLFEELVFRKLLAGRLARYGTVFASVVSALVFGLYHGNFEQFFYAFFVGIILSYVYCVYGKIIYSILIHIAINAIGSFIPLMLEIGETSEITTPQMIYLYLYVMAFASGGFILISKCRQSLFNLVEGYLIKPWRVLVLNPGFISAVIISFFMFIYNIL